MPKKTTKNYNKILREAHEQYIDKAFLTIHNCLEDRPKSEQCDWCLKTLSEINSLQKDINTYNLMTGNEFSFNELSELWNSCDQKKVTEYFNKIPYTDYLESGWWKTISAEKKKRCSHCVLCGGTAANTGGSVTKFNVHHTSYNIRGQEIEHMGWLTVLCEDCHEGYHKLIEKKK